MQNHMPLTVKSSVSGICGNNHSTKFEESYCVATRSLEARTRQTVRCHTDEVQWL